MTHPSDNCMSGTKWYIAILLIAYAALVYYGCFVSGAEDKLDEIQQRHDREHGL